MANRSKALKNLEIGVASSIQVFQNAITSMQDANKEYARIHAEIVTEQEELEATKTSIYDKIKQSESMLEKFTNLLK